MNLLNQLEDRLISAWMQEQIKLMDTMDAEEYAWYLAYGEVIDATN